VALRITCWTNVLWPMLHLSPLCLSYHLQSFGTVPSQFSGMPARSQRVASVIGLVGCFFFDWLARLMDRR
jgi:hypothetical protein